jgi:hypothetical protein
MAPTVGRRERKDNLWMMVITCTNWNLIRKQLGTSGFEEEAVRAFGE